MEIKNIHKIYFSPTCGTKKIIDEIAKNIQIDNIETSDITVFENRKKEINMENSLALIGVPVYYGRVEKTALNYIKNYVKGNDTPAVIVVAYGNRHYDDALVELYDVVKENNFKIIGAGAFVAKHSFSNNKYPIAQNRPDSKDLEEAKTFASKINDKLNNLDEINIEGNRPYKDIKEAPKFLMKIKLKKDLCNNCNKCAIKCPMNAIHKSDVNKIDYNACISCAKCIDECEENAKSMGFFVKNVAAKALSKSKRREVETYL